MPLNPDFYAGLLGKKMELFNTRVFLINTGWSGGCYGVGKRIDLPLTRRMVNAALNGELDHVEYAKDPLFHVQVPTSCPGVPSEMLNPVNTWADKAAYNEAAEKLAKQFSAHFDKAYGSKNLAPEIVKQCPGK
jgi:phosphoenolpyruvate carboxykinase (ATP)